MAANLHAALKGHISSHHAKGLTNKTLYVRLWEAIQGQLHESSHKFWSVPHKTLRNILLARFGGLYSQRMARRYGHAQNIDCPLCKLDDGAGHILGGCAHRDMKAMYIERHNAAGRFIAQEVRNGKHGNHVMIGDVGNAEKCMGLDFHSNRLPEWLLSDEDCSTADSIRAKLRPDLMLISTTNQTAARLDACKKRAQHGRRCGMLSTGHPDHPVKIMIVEIGYTSETRYDNKLQEKLAQHDRLKQALTSVGFEVNILPVILGTTGGVFNSNIDSFRAMGITQERALHLINKLSKHAIDYMQTIIDLRRLMQRNPPP